ncbi:MAG: 6-pyruvoyl-tetrahydropterin synthase-related protein [Gammaproteobacteria bacterium]|nr:6-pyruvoyl-tetrahydropterin synthase-related protein [Gammaproteobacteria bacterium]
MKEKTMAPWVYYTGLILFYGCIALLLILPIASNTAVPHILDYLSHISGIVEANAAWSEGQFLLRTAPIGHNGWEYPFFQFYSPTSYAFAGLVYRWVTPSNPFMAYKITVICALVLGGLGIHRLVYWWLNSYAIAILASVVYLFSPYNIIIINNLGAFNEVIALGILPFVLYYTLQRYYNPVSSKTFLQVSILWYALLTIHLITFVYSSIFIGLFLLIVSLQNKRFSNLFRVGIAYVFGCFLAIWYFAPILFFNTILVVHRTFDIPFSHYFPSFVNLLSPFVKFTPPTRVQNGYLDSMSAIHPNIGLPILLAACVSMYIFFSKQSFKKLNEDNYLLPLLALFFIAFMFIWSPINFWDCLPKSLLIIQYSWRLLGQVMWVGALLFAGVMYWLFNNKFSTKYIMLGVILLVAFNGVGLFKKNEMVTNVLAARLIDLPFILESENNYEVYIIDVKKNPKFVSLIDNVPLFKTASDEAYGDHVLKLNLKHSISRDLLNSAVSPYVVVQAAVPVNINLNHQQLIAVIDEKQFIAYDLKPGPFEWKISLNQFQNKKSKTPLTFYFKLSGENQKGYKLFPIAIKNISLAGFLNDSEVMNLQQVEKQCVHKNSKTICTLDVPSTIRTVELPVLYYPEMLGITVNGKAVDYKSVFYNGSLITAVTSEAGKQNIIEFQFRGLLWANYLSLTAWGIVGLLFLYTLQMYVRGE